MAQRTYLDNFPRTTFFRNRCEQLPLASIRRRIRKIDILLASPECTSHTCAKGSSPRSEKSRSTAFQVVRFAKALRPRWIIVENVIHMRSWRRFQTWLKAIQSLGYHTRVQTLNSADFGVAQSRKRLFVTADLKGMPPVVEIDSQFRVPIHTLIESNNGFKYTPLRKKGRARPTLVRARRAMKKLGTRKSFLLVYYGSDGAGGWQRTDRPLRTITTVDRFAFVRPVRGGHEIRMLQVPELSRAMGFPTNHVFLRGTRRDKIKLIGNAVCPPVISAVIRSLTKQNLERPLGNSVRQKLLSGGKKQTRLSGV
jgi:DNA (cytosine-5)-methyltransferase 1